MDNLIDYEKKLNSLAKLSVNKKYMLQSAIKIYKVGEEIKKLKIEIDETIEIINKGDYKLASENLECSDYIKKNSFFAGIHHYTNNINSTLVHSLLKNEEKRKAILDRLYMISNTASL